jgi:hypothetical protein
LAALTAATGAEIEIAPASPTIGFPIIAVERLRALGLAEGRTVAQAMPDLVSRMKRSIEGEA